MLVKPDYPASDFLPMLCCADGCISDPAPGKRYCFKHIRSRATQWREHEARQAAAVEVRIRRISPSIKTHLYAIEIVGSDMLKFGMSGNPADRMMALQISTPVPLRLLGHVGCDRQLERDVHLYCAEHRVRGEWFRREGRTQTVLALILADDPVSIYGLIGREPPSALF